VVPTRSIVFAGEVISSVVITPGFGPRRMANAAEFVRNSSGRVLSMAYPVRSEEKVGLDSASQSCP
jgi:hypothetical protein